MSETFTAVCNSALNDQIKATADGTSVLLSAHSGGLYKMDAILSPEKARAFAVGVLKLAGGIDGIAAPVPTVALKVGDRVTVVTNGPGDGQDNVGEAGVLERIDAGDTDLPYRVMLDKAGEGSWWCHAVRKVDALKVGDRVEVVKSRVSGGFTAFEGRKGELREIDTDDTRLPYRVRLDESGDVWAYVVRKVDAIPAPEPAPVAPLKVGDRVRIVVDDPHSRAGQYVGRVGKLEHIEDVPSTLPYLVKFGDGRHGATDGAWYCREVVKVEDESALADAAAEAPAESLADPRRVRLLVEAGGRAGSDASLTEVLSLARYLAGE